MLALLRAFVVLPAVVSVALSPPQRAAAQLTHTAPILRQQRWPGSGALLGFEVRGCEILLLPCFLPVGFLALQLWGQDTGGRDCVVVLESRPWCCPSAEQLPGCCGSHQGPGQEASDTLSLASSARF